MAEFKLVETKEEAVKLVLNATAPLGVWKTEKVEDGNVEKELMERYDYITEHYANDKGNAPSAHEVAGMLLRYEIDDCFQHPRFDDDLPEELLKLLLAAKLSGALDDESDGLFEAIVGVGVLKGGHLSDEDIEALKTGKLPEKCEDCDEEDCPIKTGEVTKTINEHLN